MSNPDHTDEKYQCNEMSDCPYTNIIQKRERALSKQITGLMDKRKRIDPSINFFCIWYM